ncbi:hypothetical protein D3227_33345 [Mesorhizobium waimense]|uniref:Uncharacterized protein n=1 Tax=Mesorhizobium waimense TaxID=1300307 RepID=A0A3A5K334_9HYPH|nr:hypothetical protein D3227_33345 [Mesorhizobium waimense]
MSCTKAGNVDFERLELLDSLFRHRQHRQRCLSIFDLDSVDFGLFQPVVQAGQLFGCVARQEGRIQPREQIASFALFLFGYLNFGHHLFVFDYGRSAPLENLTAAKLRNRRLLAQIRGSFERGPKTIEGLLRRVVVNCGQGSFRFSSLQGFAMRFGSLDRGFGGRDTLPPGSAFFRVFKLRQTRQRHAPLVERIAQTRNFGGRDTLPPGSAFFRVFKLRQTRQRHAPLVERIAQTRNFGAEAQFFFQQFVTLIERRRVETAALGTQR